MQLQKAMLAAIGWLLICGMICHSAQANGTSGGIVFKQGVGARAQGMGEAFAAVADDATGLYWNVAGLSRNKGVQLTAAYFTGLLDSAYEQLMYIHALDQFGVKNGGSLGLGLVMLQGGPVILDEPSGEEKSVQSESDMVLSLGCGVKLADQLGCGVSFKYFRSTLAEEASAAAFGADLGLLLAITENISLAAVLQNIGTEIKYKDQGDPLPVTVRLGVGYSQEINGSNAIVWDIDLVKANDRDYALHTGGEYWYNRTIAVRLGYKAGYDLTGLTAGFGWRVSVLQVDYALGLVQDFNATHKFSLSLAL